MSVAQLEQRSVSAAVRESRRPVILFPSVVIAKSPSGGEPFGVVTADKAPSPGPPEKSDDVEDVEDVEDAERRRRPGKVNLKLGSK